MLPQHDCTSEELISAAAAAEDAGFDSVWVSDHLHGWRRSDRAFLECISALSAVAVSTARVRVGTLVLRAGLRPPAVVAAAARTIDDMSEGRLTLGLGSGDGGVESEESSYGLPPRSMAVRREVLAAAVDYLRTHLPSVPLLIGGTSDASMLLARSVGTWNFWGSVDEMEARLFGLPEDARPAKIFWAGMFPGPEGIAALARMGVDEVAVAVGAQNYSERIRSLRDSV